jgi:hypothetical protein
LEVPLYRFFTDGKKVKMPKLPATRSDEWEIGGEHQHGLRVFAKTIKRMGHREQKLLLDLAQKMARRRSKV